MNAERASDVQLQLRRLSAPPSPPAKLLLKLQSSVLASVVVTKDAAPPSLVAAFRSNVALRSAFALLPIQA